MKIHEYRSTSGWKVVSNRIGDYPDESHLGYYYVSGSNKQIRYPNTNASAGITIPAKPDTKYRLILNGNITSLNANNSGYYYYVHTAGEAYDAATNSHTVANNIMNVRDIVRTYDRNTNKTTFEFTTYSGSALYPVLSLNFTTYSIYYGPANPAGNVLYSLYDSISEETPAGWQEIDPYKRVNGAWTTGSAHKRSSGTWD